MVVLSCSSVHHCFEVAAMAAGIFGEGIAEVDIANEEILYGETAGVEVGYEGTDFLDGSFSNQETKKYDGLSLVPMVAKS